MLSNSKINTAVLGGLIATGIVGLCVLFWMRFVRVPREKLETMLALIESKKLPPGNYTSTAFNAAEQNQFDLISSKENRFSNLNFTVQANGNIVLLWKSSIGWKSNFDGYVLSKNPLKLTTPPPRGELSVPGIDEFFVRDEIDNRCWEVFFDLN